MQPPHYHISFNILTPTHQNTSLIITSHKSKRSGGLLAWCQAMAPVLAMAHHSVVGAKASRLWLTTPLNSGVIPNLVPNSIFLNFFSMARAYGTTTPSLISDVQTAFVPGRQILDGPFIINELLAWCKHYKHQAMVFKVDFAKAYNSVRWDYLMDVLKSFGFGDKWCGWIKGSLSASDPLAPYLFILVMESLHLSFSRTVDVGIFKGIQIVGVSNDATVAAATNLGCAIMKALFKYLGVMVGGNMSRIDAWDETLSNLRSRLSKWKSKTLSIGGRLTLLKSVLGSSPIYVMSLYKVPKFVLSSMEAIRRNFFYGSQEADKNITWVKWSKVLAAKQFGGLGVSSLFSLYSAIS
ncbi:RNA-directed DNA polymerase, eukaryota [Tanacetum coccineum]|uniref:RNA-directed DNA polymerase, eukaryota n=1 Tax=Tanacetum coccineum TaxID=301880 RepID=A0ABQ5GMF9_9ASTR